MMFRLILIAAVTCAGLAYGETAEALRERIEKLSGVVSCNWAHKAAPRSVPNHDFHMAILEWYYTDAAGVRRKGSAEVHITGFNTPAEAAVWFGEPPAIDRPAPEPEEDPLGTDEEILAAIATPVIKPTIERGKEAASVTGYEEVGADVLPVKYLVFFKGDVLVAVREKSGADTKGVVE
jgi:hypothetical protein